MHRKPASLYGRLHEKSDYILLASGGYMKALTCKNAVALRQKLSVHHAEAIAGVGPDDVVATGKGSAQQELRNQVRI